MKKVFTGNFKRLTGLMLALIMLVSMAPMQLNAASDLQGHFAEQHMGAFIAHGFISIFPDGTARPNHTMSRAEFYTMVNRVFGFTDLDVVGFVDVTPDDWFFQEISKAQAAGYIIGGAEALPYRAVTREEAAAMVARLTGLTPFAAGADQFSDVNPSSWSAAYIGAAVAAGLMNGYPDGTFVPYGTISRAEAVIVMTRAMDRVRDIMDLPELNLDTPAQQPQIDIGAPSQPIVIVQPVQQPVQPIILEPLNPVIINRAPSESDFRNFAQVISWSSFGGGRDSRSIRGDVLVDTISGTIRDLEVFGNLIFSERTSGNFTLTNVRVHGSIYVFGNPRITLDNSDARELIVNSVRTGTSVTLRRASDIPNTRVFSAVTLSESNLHNRHNGFSNVTIESNFNRSARVNLGGNFNRVDVFERAALRIDRGNVSRLVIGSGADRSSVDVASGAIIDNLEVSGVSTSFTGTGRIRSADVRVTGVTFNRRPDSNFGHAVAGNWWGVSNNWWTGRDHSVRVQVVGRGNQLLRDASVEISILERGIRHTIASGWTDRNGNFDTWVPTGWWWDSNDTLRIDVRWGGQSTSRNIRARDLGHTVRIDFPHGDWWWPPVHPPAPSEFFVTVNGSQLGAAQAGQGHRTVGSTVTVTTTGRPNHIFDGWQVTSGGPLTITNHRETTASFTMPNRNVTLTANWIPVPGQGSGITWDVDDIFDNPVPGVVLDGAIPAISSALSTFTASNSTTVNDVRNVILNAANAQRVRGFASGVTETGITVTVDNFNLTPATGSPTPASGTITFTLTLQSSGVTRNLGTQNLTIPALP
ncbi:MAG: S-layer homology domain-containing protein [Defluviitaleaceae bacterium]|nr:S-layer homology domain-containing protein [Defluviitaleaceae bacterium]